MFFFFFENLELRIDDKMLFENSGNYFRKL